jgi:hypothetical protein
MSKYIVTTTNRTNYTGVDAGGVAFANGEATITDDRMAAWFREHEGYAVETIEEGAEGTEKQPKRKTKAAENKEA